MGHQIGVGNQHPRRVAVGFEYAYRLAGLYQQGFVVFQALQHLNDLVKTLPVAGGAADAAVHHQRLRVFGNVRVQVVHQHPQGGFGQPAFTAQLAAVRGANMAAFI